MASPPRHDYGRAFAFAPKPEELFAKAGADSPPGLHRREYECHALHPGIPDRIISEAAYCSERRGAAKRVGIEDAMKPGERLPCFDQARLQADDHPRCLRTRQPTSDRPKRQEWNTKQVSNRSIEGTKHRFCL